MISFIKPNKELIIVLGTYNYYEIIYRRGNDPSTVFHGRWSRSNDSIILYASGVKHKVTQQEFDSLNHFFKTEHCHGEIIMEGTQRIESVTTISISK